MDVAKLSVSLGGREVIRQASLSVGTGEFIGLLGPNGAGKTTLMRALLGLIPFSGRVSTHAATGYVPQRHDVEWDFPISVYNATLSGRTGLIGWLRRPQARDHAAVREALALTNLEGLSRRSIAELSGGQRQRVLIARAGHPPAAAAFRRALHRPRRPQHRGFAAAL